jgi:hypothetical protein
MKPWVWLCLAAVGICFPGGGIFCGLPLQPQKQRTKFTIKQVMKEAIKGDTALVKKACKGTATPEELSKMIEYFKALGELEPPRGDIDSWQQKTTRLREAAELVQQHPQDKEASFKLEQAVECRQCHNVHKPGKN